MAAIVTFTVVAADQASKLWADRTLSAQRPIEVIENFFHLTLHHNTGGVFGLLSGQPTLLRRGFFITAVFIAIAFLLYYMREWGRGSTFTMASLALILGGAVGNLIDRMLYGRVIDFIDWHWYDHHWPTFNIADSAILVGSIMLFASVLLSPEPEQKKAA